MSTALLWPIFAALGAGLQIVRNLAQRELIGALGLWGAAYVRFLYGVPFASLWLVVILCWRGPAGAPSWTHLGLAALGSLCQGAATALLLAAMRDRSFAVANALQKSEAIGGALLGLMALGDQLGVRQWLGLAVTSVGVALAALGGDAGALRVVSLRAGACGLGAGLCFSVSSVAYRAASFAWGGDLWVAAGVTLLLALLVQTLIFGLALALLRPAALAGAFAAWRPSLVPGATGAVASASIFTAFALSPSVGLVKAVQSIDVLLAWVVSGRLRERIGPLEATGAALTLLGIAAVLA